MEEARLSVNIPLPKALQFDASTQITLRGDSREELEALFDQVFGEDAFKIVVAKAFFTVTQEVNVPSIPAEPVASSGPVVAASTTGSPNVGSVCPACGRGTLVNKKRRDGTGSFTACDQFPGCNFILKRG